MEPTSADQTGTVYGHVLPLLLLRLFFLGGQSASLSVLVDQKQKDSSLPEVFANWAGNAGLHISDLRMVDDPERSPASR